MDLEEVGTLAAHTTVALDMVLKEVGAPLTRMMAVRRGSPEIVLEEVGTPPTQPTLSKASTILVKIEGRRLKTTPL